ncbi:UNVERIFIED_CONTAM: GATA transcription factor 15 [Sesamum angustifolium]|uniref:GATA transcription factor 15 n=1 Tax=Sesamum angustifolium TaxID=2727405 RepID=A0AAW2NY10_9LAMI
MMDLSDKGSECEEMSSQAPTRIGFHLMAQTSRLVLIVVPQKTSMERWSSWKSLCNACGIRSRKKRRALMGVAKEEKKTKKSTSGKNSSHHHSNSNSSSSNSSSSSSGDSTGKIGDSFKKKLWAFGRDVALQRPRSNTTRRRKLGEEEQAAFLLMALSCGSVYA